MLNKYNFDIYFYKEFYTKILQKKKFNFKMIECPLIKIIYRSTEINICLISFFTQII